MREKKKIGRNILSITLLFLGLSIFLAVPVRAQYCSLQKSALGYSQAGVLVLKETLHATGYSLFSIWLC